MSALVNERVCPQRATARDSYRLLVEEVAKHSGRIRSHAFADWGLAHLLCSTRVSESHLPSDAAKRTSFAELEAPPQKPSHCEVQYAWFAAPGARAVHSFIQSMAQLSARAAMGDVSMLAASIAAMIADGTGALRIAGL